MWDYTGLVVSGLYMGEIPVTGKVRLSRVKYGGTVSHHIDLKTPITVYGAVRESVILDMNQVTQVQSN
jgi:hypothetical protein